MKLRRRDYRTGSEAEIEEAEVTEPAVEAETEAAEKAQAEAEIEETVEPAETPSMDATVVIADLKPAEETRPTIDLVSFRQR